LSLRKQEKLAKSLPLLTKLFFLAFANKNKVFISKATGLVNKKTKFFYRLLCLAKQRVLVQIFLKAKLFSLLVPFALQSKGQKQVIIK
jgi:hypothetical protein